MRLINALGARSMYFIPRLVICAGLFAAFARGQSHAVELDGVGGFATAPGVGSLVSNSTWEAWIKIPQDATAPGVVLQRWGGYSHALGVDPVQGTFGVDMYSCWTDPCGQTTSAAGTIVRDTWQHIALVYGPESAPSCDAYVDGVRVAWCGPQQCVPSGGWETVLGAWGFVGYSNFFRGCIDEVRISSVRRYASNFTPSRDFTPDAATVGLWHFDEGAGSTAFDASGNGRHFSLQAGISWTYGLPLCNSPQTCCVNVPATYCTAGTTTNGCAPTMSAVGTPSATAGSGFDIICSNSEGDRYGLILYGMAPAAVSWAINSTSLVCVAPPQRRTGAYSSGGILGTCTGTYSLDFNAFIASDPFALGSPFTAGQIFYAQAWFRDPGAPKGTNLSNGIQFTLCN